MHKEQVQTYAHERDGASTTIALLVQLRIWCTCAIPLCSIIARGDLAQLAWPMAMPCALQQARYGAHHTLCTRHLTFSVRIAMTATAAIVAARRSCTCATLPRAPTLSPESQRRKALAARRRVRACGSSAAAAGRSDYSYGSNSQEQRRQAATAARRSECWHAWRWSRRLQRSASYYMSLYRTLSDTYGKLRPSLSCCVSIRVV
jgi:hypothetical protein